MRVDPYEVVRLCRAVADRPRWQRVAAFTVSAWALPWILAQFTAGWHAPSALNLLDVAVEKVGLPADRWADRMAGAWRDAHVWPAVVGGLLWAATTERRQWPALVGWVAVMLGSESLGYQQAVLTALGSLVAFVVVLWLCAFTDGRFVDRRPKLLPADVLRAGVIAATLSATVPLFAVGTILAGLCNPYVTRPPELVTGRPEVPAGKQRHPNRDLPSSRGEG